MTMPSGWWRRAALTAAVLAASVFLLVWLYGDWLITQAYRITLEEPSRIANFQIDRVIDVLEIRPGQRVVDLGAGTGVFTRPFARATAPDGIVYAVDVNPELLKHVERTATEQHLSNIRTVLAEEADPRIPEPVDLIFICDTLHHIASRETYVATLRRYLKPGGRVAVIDFRQGSSPHLMGSMKYTLEQLDGWMLDAGYTVAGRHDFIDDNFFVVYRCAACPER